MSKEAVANIIKSCIVSRKGGVPLLDIEDEYKEFVGESIPFVSLGYKTLFDFINSISFVKVRQNYFGDSVLFVSDPKVAHIDSLVSKQKTASSRNAGPKKSRKNRYEKSRQRSKFGTNNRNGSRRGFNNESANGHRPENFEGNARMEYTRSKWYSGRTKDSWRQRNNESRSLARYNNFNARRTTMPNSSNDSSLQNDNSWSGRITSQSSIEENMYNFHSYEERRYAQESRSWRFQVQVADANRNSMVGRSQHGAYNYQECQSDPFPPRQFGGGPTNNHNNGWRDWCPNSYEGWAPRDNQSGKWWPGLQGFANSLLPWMGVPQSPQIYPSHCQGDDRYCYNFYTY